MVDRRRRRARAEVAPAAKDATPKLIAPERDPEGGENDWRKLGPPEAPYGYADAAAAAWAKEYNKQAELMGRKTFAVADIGKPFAPYGVRKDGSPMDKRGRQFGSSAPSGGSAKRGNKEPDLRQEWLDAIDRSKDAYRNLAMITERHALDLAEQTGQPVENIREHLRATIDAALANAEHEAEAAFGVLPDGNGEATTAH